MTVAQATNSATTGPAPSSPDEQGGGGVAAGGFVGAAGQAAADVGGRSRARGRRPARPARSAPSADRTDPTASYAGAPTESRRSAAWTAVALVLSR